MRPLLWPTPGCLRNIAYDYGTKAGRLDLTCHTTLNQEACVWIFDAIDPAAQIIEVLHDGAPRECHTRGVGDSSRTRLGGQAGGPFAIVPPGPIGVTVCLERGLTPALPPFVRPRQSQAAAVLDHPRTLAVFKKISSAGRAQPTPPIAQCSGGGGPPPSLQMQAEVLELDV